MFDKFLRLVKIKKTFLYPNKVQILIYDKSGSELFIKYFTNYTFSILYVRDELLNIPILIKSIIKRQKYQLCYIEYVSPKILITFIDNNPFFYSIKSYQPQLITIFVQNGIRSIAGDVFEYLIDNPISNYHVDHMLCFNSSLAKKYSDYIEGETLVVGSFKNNLLPIKSNKSKNKKEVVFVSQFRYSNSHKSIMMHRSGEPIYWNDFYSSEKFLLPILATYCEEHNFNLLICGCSNENSFEEINFYNQILGTSNWQYIRRTSKNSSYDSIDKADYIVTIDSTLGYEAVSRNKRVAFFTIRGEKCRIDGVNFAWPQTFSAEGSFWTNSSAIDEIIRVLNFVVTSEDEIWDKVKFDFKNNILSYDEDNSKFQKLINSILEK